MLVAHPSTGFRTLKDLLDAAGKSPGKIIYASAGNGTSGHLAMELLKQRAKVSMLHIPYRGGAPAVNDLLAGHAQVMIINPDIVLPHVQAGKLVALATTGRVRSPVYPQVLTVIEAPRPIRDGHDVGEFRACHPAVLHDHFVLEIGRAHV